MSRASNSDGPLWGSHNALTYAPPLRWWRRLWAFAWRCQSRNVFRQYDRGARIFDIRVALDPRCPDDTPDGLETWCGAHSGTLLRVKPLWCLVRLISYHRNRTGDPGPIAFRLVLEQDTPTARVAFAGLCGALENQYADTPGVVFFGGIVRHGWEHVYDFRTDPGRVLHLALYEHVGSVQSRWYGKVWPWLWARLHPDAPKDKPFMIKDFV